MDSLASNGIAPRILVTGGAGFIGSAFLNLFVPKAPDSIFLNIDSLSYAGNLGNLTALSRCPNYEFKQLDITDQQAVNRCFESFHPDWVVHFAAESHVDRSILDPGAFVRTNVIGTYNLLEAARRTWSDLTGKVFHHVSTDEVFGSLGSEGFFTETTAYDPSSPYSASKAGSDHIARAYHRTFGLPVKITNCSNNYGPRQFPEKLIPLMILNADEGKPLPVYGKGENVRDWLFVDDHCRAIWSVIQRGVIGETYNIGGNSERTNLQVVEAICKAVEEKTGKSGLADLITYVADRPGHDLRYAIDASKIKNDLGWEPTVTFEEGLSRTVSWYLDNPAWVNSVRTGAYRDWLETNYSDRSRG